MSGKASIPPEIQELPTIISSRYSEELVREFGPRLPRLLALGTMQVDELADRVVADVAAMPGRSGWALIDELFHRGLDPQIGERDDVPESMRELLQQVLQPPDWVDFDLVDYGARTYWRAGFQVGFGLLNSLAFGYRSGRLSESMVRTGRIDRMARRRLQETARWVLLATTPGAMRPDQADPNLQGIAVTVHVRLIHALVRRQHLENGWDVDQLAMPISASDSAMTTAAGFLALPVGIWERLGIRYTRQEKDAMNHLWRWISHVIGVPPELQAATFAQADALKRCVEASMDPPSEGSKRLMAALLREGIPEPEGVPKLLQPVAREGLLMMHRATFRFGLGTKEAAAMDVSWTPTMPLLTVGFPIAFRAAEFAQLVPGIPSDRWFGDRVRKFVHRRLDETGAPVATLSAEDAAREPLVG